MTSQNVHSSREKRQTDGSGHQSDNCCDEMAAEGQPPKNGGRGQQNFPRQGDRLVFQAEASVSKARLPFEEMKESLEGWSRESMGEDWREMKSKSEVAGRRRV